VNRLLSVAVALAGAVFLLAACDSAGPSSERNTVEVGFATSYSISGTAAARAAVKSNHDGVEIEGTNGTLSITDIRLIVSEFELDGDDSADFEAGPSFLDLPLDTNEVAPLAANQIPPGRYDEFEFEVEDVEADEDDDDEQSLEGLRESILEDFPDWPDDASMVVVGTFTRNDNTSTDFTTYFEAEIEIERELNPALEVSGDGLSRSLTVRLDPTRWFRDSDGTVRDLSQFDYASTDDLVEFEAEFEDGVTEIEVDGGGDDGDDNGDDDNGDDNGDDDDGDDDNGDDDDGDDD
jgi:hypothetical protein